MEKSLTLFTYKEKLYKESHEYFGDEYRKDKEI